MKIKKKLLNLIFICIMISFNLVPIFNPNISTIILQIPQSQAITTPKYELDHLVYDSPILVQHIKGSNTLIYKASTTLKSASTQGGGLYLKPVQIWNIDAYSVSDASISTQLVFRKLNQEFSQWYKYATYSICTTLFECQSEKFVIPNTWDATHSKYYYTDSDASYQLDYYNATISSSLTGDYYTNSWNSYHLKLYMNFVLYPTLILNSTYYNFQNIKVQVYDKANAQWIEQDPNNLILNFPEYKMRIYDLNYNLLYEDVDYVIFTNVRTITIDSLRLTNNAPEPVNMSLVENGHYQGKYSWGLDTPNLQPSNVDEYGDEGSVSLQNEEAEYNKVIYVNSATSTQYGTNEFQIDSSLSDLTISKAVNTDMLYLSAKTLDTRTISNVLDVYDNNATASVYAEKSFQSASVLSGWIASNQTSTDFGFYTYDGGSNIGIFRIHPTNYFQWYDGAYKTVKSTISANHFYHFVLNYNFSSDTVQIFIDTVYQGTWNLVIGASKVDKVRFTTWSTSTNYHGYIGSFYHGDSLSDALLSYNASSYFSINSTQDTYGNEFQTGLSGWSDQDGANCESSYQSSQTLSNYLINNVMQLYDNDATTTAGQQISFSDANTYFSFWIACSDTTKTISVVGFESATACVNIYIDNGIIYLYNGVGNSLGALANNEWCHIVLEVNIITDMIDVFRDGIYIGNYICQNAITTKITRFVIYTKTTDSAYYGYCADFYYGNSFSEAISSFHANESIEWWQKQNAVSAMQFGETIINFGYTICYLNGSTLIYNQNQMIDEWTHYRLEINGFEATLYRNLIELATFDRFSLSLDSLSFFAFGDCDLWIDAVDFSWADGYSLNRNMHLNESEELWCWEAFPVWESEYYQNTINWGTSENQNLSKFTLVQVSGEIISIENEFQDHNDVIDIRDPDATAYGTLGYFFSPQTEGTIEMNFAQNPYPDVSYLYLSDSSGQAIYMYLQHGGSGGMKAYNGGSLTQFFVITSNIWYNIKIQFDCNRDKFNIWIDGVQYVVDWSFLSAKTTIDRLYIGTTNTFSTDVDIYLDGFSCSWEDEYFNQISTLENATYSPLPMSITTTFQVNPYSPLISNYTVANYLIGITDLYSNLLEVQVLDSTENSITYTPSETRECFISLANQRGDYLNWENYRLYINNTQIYSNVFYSEITTTVNVSIYTRFNKYITSTLHTVDRESNYIPITITQFSLKIYNQQEKFIFSNITFDPIYYSSDQYWSEWIAPGEIVSYFLSPEHYRVNITEYETSTTSIYSYYLTGDDLLLITSANTIANAITSIVNTNTTIGNQITAVNISISNTQSNISNQIVSVNIDLSNVNSTLGSQLVSIESQLTNLNSTIGVMYAFMNNSFIALNSSMDTQFLSINTTIANINSSIGLLISDLESTVLLVNNSIYTAVVDVGTTLLLINNTIQGNLSLILELNPELSAIYTNCLFSKNLTWSTNLTAMYDQFDYYTFINNYRNESVEIFFKYGSEVLNMQLGAQETINQAIKNSGTQYRIKSIQTGEYISDWKPLPSNKTVNFGFYDEVIPATPEQIQFEIKDYLLIALFATVCLAVVIVLYIRTQSTVKPSGKIIRNRPGVRNTSIISDNDFMPTKPQEKGSKKAILVVAIVIIIVFICSYFLM